MTKVRLLLANLVAGAVGGSAAAALTQPLDVVKTRAQLGHHGRSTSVYQASLTLATAWPFPLSNALPQTTNPQPACDALKVNPWHFGALKVHVPLPVQPMLLCLLA